MAADLFFPIASAFLWAISVPVVALGIRRIPRELILAGIFAGLLTSLTTGTLFLGLFVGPKWNGVEWNGFHAIAGVLTFPVGTGLYYLCGYGFQGKMEVAAQFTKVKPVLSCIIAFAILGEPLPSSLAISLVLVALGIGLLIHAETAAGIRYLPLMLGLLTAASWAAGEAFVKIGFSRETTLPDTFSSLLVATGTAAIFLIPYLIMRRRGLWPTYKRIVVPFAVHGFLSISLAYTLYFHSISINGLGKTALVNAFWPLLSIFLTYLILGKAKGDKLNLKVIVAGALLLSASLLIIFT